MRLTAILLLITTCSALSGYSQRTDIYKENFEGVISYWELNSGKIGGLGTAAENLWTINDKYAGGMIISGPDTVWVDTTSPQPAGIDFSPSSGYLHSYSQSGIATGVQNANFLPEDKGGGIHGRSVAIMDTCIDTRAWKDVELKFWWLLNGGDNVWGSVYYSNDDGMSWNYIDSFNKFATWRQDSFTMAAFDSVKCLKFAFVFEDLMSADSTDKNPGLGIDDIELTGTYDCPVTITGIATDSITCPGDNDGTITISATGGSGPLFYSIDSGMTFVGTNSFTGLTQGRYIVVVKDSVCDQIDTVEIRGPAVLDVTTSYVGTSGASECDGSATVGVTGGTPPYTYLWDDSDAQTTPTAVGLCPGTYKCTVTDSLGCTLGVYTFTIDVWGGLNNLDPASVNVFPNPSNGKVTIEATSDFHKYVLVNVYGQAIEEGFLTSGEIEFQKGLQGIYFLELYARDGRVVKALQFR